MDEGVYLQQLQTRWDAVWPHPSLPRQPIEPFGELPVHRYLERRAEQTPARDFLIYYGKRLSYAEVDRLSNRFASWLHEVGVGKGGRVALVLPNCPQFYIAYFGALKIGAVAVLLNPILKSLELAHLFRESQPQVVVAIDQALGEVARGLERIDPSPRVLGTRFADFLPAVPELAVPPSMQANTPAWPAGVESLLDRLADQSEDRPDVTIAMTDVATMNFTGGTTGMPKGVLHRHRNILYTAACIYTYSYNDWLQAHYGEQQVDVPAVLADLFRSEVILAAMPIFWIAGKDNGVDGAVVAGASVVLLGRWEVATALDAIHRYRVTQFYAPFDLYGEMLAAPERSRCDLTSLRLCVGSSFIKGLTPELRARWRDVTQGALLREAAYGLTESHTMDTMTAGFQRDDGDIERAEQHQGAFCGIPMPGTDIEIVDPDSGELLPPGREGTVVIRSPSVVDGYANHPEETAKSFHDGWLSTGDVGKYDADGFFYYLSRTKYMLKVSGISVYPTQIEALLLGHPAVQMACVIGTDDPQKGQVPVAYVKLAEPLDDAPDEATLRAWCKDNMAAYNVPREIIIADTLPLTATGKVIREALIERYRDRQDASASPHPGSRRREDHRS